ncbi:hypothetical protein [Flavobacterium lacisediminis]|uniref:Histidine kinase n=1 Tax=Flavobacterium lacisediminis TaxID=2989705 RepID=A0ABT3EF61_9FLAO|nr:hypothetical protein [Flavobacterium lacisediminis]MCW1147213.1 hypothetical protein [Flavobacterium lacisediminis]
MKLISMRMGIFVSVFFIVNLAIKKYLFEEQIDNKAIISTLVGTLIVGLVYYFLNRKKTTSKDN